MPIHDQQDHYSQEWDMVTAYTALIIEDDAQTARAISLVARSLGYVTYTAASVVDARTATGDFTPEILLVDLGLPDGDGIGIVEEYRQRGVEDFIIISGTRSQDRVVEALRAGASDFLTKPVKLSDIQQVMQRVIRERYDRLLGKATPARNVWIEPVRLDDKADASRELSEHVDAIAAQKKPQRVIIEGKTGVGKREIAACIHEKSNASGQLILVNCAQEIDEAAMIRFFGRQQQGESQVAPCAGYFELAANGTLVLDDLSRLPIALQSALVNYFRAADSDVSDLKGTGSCCCSVIGILREAAEQSVEENRLSPDLLRCLSEYRLLVPDIVSRGEDIATLGERAVAKLNVITGLEKGLSTEAAQAMSDYHWPGNMIEFRNLLKAAYAATGGLDDIVIDRAITPALAQNNVNHADYLTGQSFREVEEKLIIASLKHSNNNKRITADLLGISLKTLYNRLDEYKENNKGSIQ